MKKSSTLIAGIAVTIAVIVLIFISSSGSSAPISHTSVSDSSTAASSPVAVASVASLTLVAPESGTIDAGETQTVKWTSTNYTAPTVQILLIRKVSDNPARYELVRTISAKTANDGTATWVPAKTDVGTGLSIEIGCAPEVVSCAASAPSPELAVVNDGRFANTASVFQSIEAAQNK